MAFLTPRTYVAGEVHTAAHHNADRNIFNQIIGALTGTVNEAIRFAGNLTVVGTLDARWQKITPYAAMSLYFTASDAAVPEQDPDTDRFEIEFAQSVDRGCVIDGASITAGYNLTAITVKLLWYAPTAVTGDVRWRLSGRGFRAGLQHDLTLFTVDTEDVTVPTTAGELVETTLTWETTNLPQANDKVFMQLHRLGSASEDTLADDVRLQSLEVSYIG